MKSFLDSLSFRNKLLVGPAVATVLMIASVASAFYVIWQQRSAMDSISQVRLPALKAAGDADRALAGTHAGTYKLLAMMDANFPADRVQRASQDLKMNLSDVTESLEAASRKPGITAEEKDGFEKAATSIQEYRKSIEEVIDIASVQVAMATAYMSKAQNKYEDCALQLKTLRELEQRQTDASSEAAQSLARRAIYVVLLTLLLSVAISITIALYGGNAILRSLRAIGKVASKLGQGDIGHTALDSTAELQLEIDARRSDEVGDLARSFSQVVAYLALMADVSEAIASGDLARNIEPQCERDVLGHAFSRMTQQLGELVRHVRNSASEVASGSAQIADASSESARISVHASSAIDEVVSTMHEMSTNVQNVVHNTHSQATSVGETSAAITEMVASNQRVADMSKILLDIAGRSQSEVQSGINSMDKATEGLNRITNSIHGSAKMIDTLGSGVESIGKIIEVIDDLAEQTNLLALNAAIEAARAGEHGLGFAVVADEVRKLAEKSAQSTKGIGELIGKIQKEARAAVGNIEQSTAIVDEGLALGVELRSALTRISSVVGEVNNFAREIGVATSEQAHGSTQISIATSRLNEITREIAAAIEEEASGTHSIVNAMDRMREIVQQSISSSTELAANAEQMSKMSCQLLEVMGRFTLDETRVSAAISAPKLRGLAVHA